MNRKTTSKRRRSFALWYLPLALVVTAIAACSSSKPTTGIGQLGSPQRSADAGDVDGAMHGKDGEADATSAYARGDVQTRPPGHHPETGAEYVERRTGLTLSAEEKLIADTCPRRPWSKKVPQRACTRDDECGDGFCDRGQCSAIYTCRQDLGARCDLDGQCPFLLCIEGRCRSCASDQECQIRLESPNRICSPPARRAPGRECTGLLGGYTLDRKAVCVTGSDIPYCDGAERVAPAQPKPQP